MSRSYKCLSKGSSVAFQIIDIDFVSSYQKEKHTTVLVSGDVIGLVVNYI